MADVPFRVRMMAWRDRARRVDAVLSSPTAKVMALWLILLLLPFALARAPSSLRAPEFAISCDSTPSSSPSQTPGVIKGDAYCVGPFCFEPVLVPKGLPKIFGFAEFIAALALLVVLYTILDIKFRFRLRVTPPPLESITYWSLAFIGLGTLFGEVWWAEAWWLPHACWLTRNTWQMILGLVFFALVLSWLWYAFIRPPRFGRRNARRYYESLLQIMVRGNPEELAIISNEVGRSADALTLYASKVPRDARRGDVPTAVAAAHDILYLIGDRKFCRAVVKFSPGTAAAFFSAFAKHKVRQRITAAFAMNISAEAIAQKDSFLYHEDRGFYAGWLGEVKPITYAIYGNYRLIDSMRGFSPLDLHYEDRWDWDGGQWKAYCKVVLIAFENYVDAETFAAPHAIRSAFHEIGNALYDVSRPEAFEGRYHKSEGHGRINAVVRLINGALKALAELEDEHPVERLREMIPPNDDEDVYEMIARLAFELMSAVSKIEAPADRMWSIWYTAVWSPLVDSIGADNDAKRIFRARLFHLLIAEIKKLKTFPNHRNSHLLGFLLNVLGLSGELQRRGYGEETYYFTKWLRKWTQRNFRRLYAEHAHIMRWAVTGFLSYDEINGRITYTQLLGLRAAPNVTHLSLN